MVTKRNYLKIVSRSRGQSLVEFALVLPMLLLLILGAMDLGRLITTKIVLTNAAREGANYLSRNAFSDEDVTLATRITETEEIIENYCESQNVELDCCGDIIIQDCCATSSPVTVRVERTGGLIFGNVLQFLGTGIEISSEVVMRVR